MPPFSPKLASRLLLVTALTATACLLLLARPQQHGATAEDTARMKNARTQGAQRVPRHAHSDDGGEYRRDSDGSLHLLLHMFKEPEEEGSSRQKDALATEMRSCAGAAHLCSPLLLQYAPMDSWEPIAASSGMQEWMRSRLPSAFTPQQRASSRIACRVSNEAAAAAEGEFIACTAAAVGLDPSLFPLGTSALFHARMPLFTLDTVSLHAQQATTLRQLRQQGAQSGRLDPESSRRGTVVTGFHTMAAALSSDPSLRPYPYDASDHIFSSTQSLWNWLTAFFDTHFGEFHPFPLWAGQSNHTAPVELQHSGRFHMHTGDFIEMPGLPPPLQRYNATADNQWKEDEEEIRIALAADWSERTHACGAAMRASGTRESFVVAESMLLGFDAHWTLHLGDIYMVATEEEVASNCLGQAPPGVARGVRWPHGSRGSFAVPGNHEYYSRAFGFFDTFLPTLGVVAREVGPGGGNDTDAAPPLQSARCTARGKSHWPDDADSSSDATTVLPGDPASATAACANLTGQAASYLSLESRWWKFILLDSGSGTWSPDPQHDSHNNSLSDSVLRWLREEVRLIDPADMRGIVLLLHHQPISAFESDDDVYPAIVMQLASMLEAAGVHREIIILHGHEHRLSVYGPNDVILPSSADSAAMSSSSSTSNSSSSLRYHARCIGVGGFPTTIGVLPLASAAAASHLRLFDQRLYGYTSGEQPVGVGFNGFLRMYVRGPTLRLQYYSLSLDAEAQQTSALDPTLLLEETFTIAGVDPDDPDDAPRPDHHHHPHPPRPRTVLTRKENFVHPQMTRVQDATAGGDPEQGSRSLTSHSDARVTVDRSTLLLSLLFLLLFSLRSLFCARTYR